jgi:DNA-directed RNA polymerase subunit H (RpoH/RPB5)
VRRPEFVQEHKILSDSEVKSVLKKYNTTVDAFPKIHENDPQIKRIGAKNGQLVEIKGWESKQAYYRFVVKG